MDLDTFRYYTRWHHAANRRRYRAPADPWRLVHVDPADVDAYTGALPLNYGLGRVRGGDWDRDAERDPVRETPNYRGLRERFVDGRAWEDTTLYEYIAEQFEDREHVRGYDSLDAFRETRLHYLDDLHESIATDGYRANAHAAGEAASVDDDAAPGDDDAGPVDAAAGHDPADADNAFETAYASKLEPLVVLARDGDVVWTEGYHRFGIADLLDLDAVPVQVLCRHEDWQRVRDAVAREGLDAVDLPAGVDATHPDLVDVRDD
ncbi:hypothetical protein [Halorubellus litoreus]|uniref:ParB-like nuclease domain-containing protein n=1 Tax=Halorubellus litoreus TaxID=755308 RepID=A0ABD5VIS5_9EURY